MGACTFETVVKATTAAEAFNVAVSNAQWEHGHGGYSGTIAEKHDFVLLDVPEGQDPYQFAQKLMEEDDPRICDKWGPAGCVETGEDTYLFFGWASS